MSSTRRSKGSKILDLSAVTPHGVLNLQAALDVQYLYRLMKDYFEGDLLAHLPKRADSAFVQGVLMRRANIIPALEIFTFDGDLRVIEIAVLLGILELLDKIGGLSREYVFFPAWQLPNQGEVLRQYAGKESWDGFLVGLPRESSREAIAIPLELKSLMMNPREAIRHSPNEQLKSGLMRFRENFQQSGTMNCVLVMPYTNLERLSIDLKAATDDLRSAIASDSGGFVCVLSFPNDENNELAMSLLFAYTSPDPSFMQPENRSQWMREINFGRVPTS